MTDPARTETNVLVLQGGGALGAYQAGAYEALAESGREPGWLAGISIGAINAALIAGNPEGRRVERLRSFWERVTSGFDPAPWLGGPLFRRAFGEFAAATVMAGGAPGFFRPRFPPAVLLSDGSAAAISVYDTEPLKETLEELVDFDFLNRLGPRLSIGSVEVETGNFAYFDSRDMRIDVSHVMASGALPPGFPSVEIGGRRYWDGGLVSNTPLQFVLEQTRAEALCIFQVDLFSARGRRPRDLSDVSQREKDIRFSSRTRLTTDRFHELYEIAAAAKRLSEKAPDALRDDPDMAFLRSVGPEGAVTLVHLIHRKEAFETQSKDYEFSRLSMVEHWKSGAADARKSLNHKEFKDRPPLAEGIEVFDFGRRSVEPALGEGRRK